MQGIKYSKLTTNDEPGLKITIPKLNFSQNPHSHEKNRDLPLKNMDNFSPIEMDSESQTYTNDDTICLKS